MAAQSLGSYKNFLYKAYGTQGAAILIPHEFSGKVSSVKYQTADGQFIDTSYIGGNWQETGADKYNLGRAPEQLPAGKVILTLDDGTTFEQEIADPKMDFRQGSPTAPQNMNSGPGGSSGVPGGFGAGNVGYGSIPAYLGDKYPSPVFTEFGSVKAPNIKEAPYNFIDPAAFAASYGALNREQFVRNASLTKDIALDQLDTELQGLMGYAPAVAALKRGQTDADNVFNQAQRTRQIDEVLPNARGDLEAQRVRANTYAEGRIPDSITDRSLELGVRSAAADNASAGGFGTGSVAASNVSDTMAAKERLAISQYGEGLLSNNLRDASNTLLAPLQYSTAGTQINVMPSLSGSQLASKALTDLNALTTIDPTNALNNVTQQSQFATNIIQRTNEFNANLQSNTDQFNAQGQFQASSWNANTANNFALGKFGYDVTYAGLVAGASQLNTNVGLALAQQANYQQIFQDMLNKAQGAQQTSAIANGIGAIITSLGGLLNSLGGGANSPTINPSTTPGAAADNPVPPLVDQPDISSGQIENVNNSVAGPTNANAAGNTIPQGTSIDSSGNIILPNGSEMPGGFEAGGQVDGGTIIQPTPDSELNLQSFTREMKVDPSVVNSIKGSVIPKSAALVNSMGITSTPQPNSIQIGYSSAGRPVFADKTILRSQDTTLGTKTVNTFVETLNPFGVFSPEETSSLNKIGQAASDVGLIAKLTDQFNRGDKTGFVSTIVNRFKDPVLNKLTDNQAVKDGVSTAFSAFNLYNNWGQSSNAQKSIGLASLGLQAYKTATGQNLAEVAIIPSGPGNPGLTVGQGLGLFAAGYNVYSLAKNWNQLNTIQKIAAGSGSAAQIANLAQSFNLLGKGTQGATVASNAGSGAGASAGAGGSSGVVGGLNAFAGAASIALGTQQVYNNWGEGGKKATIQGALGGTAIATGLYALGSGNPYLAAGIIAASALGANVESKTSKRGASAALLANPVTAPFALLADATILKGSLTAPFKSGKGEEQVARDSIRDHAKKIGLADDKFAITLADGSKADVGADGSTDTRTVSNPGKWVGGKAPSKLHAYDTDYTNDLDYTAGIGGIALSRLTAGGKNQAIDQFGSQLGNATLKNIGYGKEFTPQNFATLMQNQRAAYAQSGIKSKADAYALADQAYKEGRIDATDLVAMQHSFNMMYDKNGYETAQKLMAGRFRGIEVAATDPAPKSDLKNPVSVKLNNPGVAQPSSAVNLPLMRPGGDMKETINAIGKGRILSKEEAAARNKLRFSQGSSLFQIGAS